MWSIGLKQERNFNVLYLLLAFLSLSLSTEAALFDGCDYTYNINGGYSYLESPYYPNSYPAGTSCRYKFIAPLDFEITINCTINLNKGANSCSSEYFYIARDGNSELRNSEQLCGAGTFIRKSLFRSVVLAYASYGSWGNFRCQLYAAKPASCDCGWSVNTKIVNGQEAGVNEFPSMVALRDKTSNLQSFCGGTIISHRCILTAAHCTRQQPNATNIEALVGDHNLQSNTETIYAARYDIIQIIEHQSYSANPVRHDIAIVITKYDMEWSRGVGPICLPATNNNLFTSSQVTVAGWGTTSFAGPFSSTLQKANLMVIDQKACSDSYNGIAPISDSQICTWDYTGNSRDSCQYDSGGPVIYKYSRQVLVGCISFGKICGQGGYATGVNTRIGSYLDWISYYCPTCYLNV